MSVCKASLMPDDDRFPRGVRSQYRRSCELVLALDEPARVGWQLTHDIAAALRKDGGLPGALQLGQAARDAALYDAGSLAEPADRFVDDAGRSSLARAVRDEAHVALSRRPGDLREMSDSQATRELLRPAIGREAVAQVFSRAFNDLVDAFGSPQAADAYVRDCLASTNLDGLADAVMRHPDGHGLRSPATSYRPPTTEDLLDQEFE
jgi:hypothetical protein